MTLRLLLLPLAFAACSTPDDGLDLVQRHNLAVQQSTPGDPRLPLEAGSAPRGVAAVGRYNTGQVYQPGSSADTATIGIPAPPATPK